MLRITNSSVSFILVTNNQYYENIKICLSKNDTRDRNHRQCPLLYQATALIE